MMRQVWIDESAEWTAPPPMPLTEPKIPASIRRKIQIAGKHAITFEAHEIDWLKAYLLPETEDK